MFKKIVSAVLFASTAISGISYAASTDEAKPLTTAQNEQLRATLTNKIGVTISKVSSTALSGIYLLRTSKGTFYSSANGDFFIQGNIYDLRGEQPIDLAAPSAEELAEMRNYRLDGVKRFKDDMIIYPAKNEKHVVTVFTDITCGYCRKLHKEMKQYNDLGITVRYLAYPRAGIKDKTGAFTKGYSDLRSIWCNEDPKAAMDKAKNGGAVAHRICDKPIEAEFEFGQEIGVSGTPAIILDNGDLVPGYRPAAELLKTLNNG